MEAGARNRQFNTRNGGGVGYRKQSLETAILKPKMGEEFVSGSRRSKPPKKPNMGEEFVSGSRGSKTPF